MKVRRRLALALCAAALAAAGCGSSTTGSDSSVAPSVFDTPLGSDAVLINGTGVNPGAPADATAPVSGGCLVRLTNVYGNDINCSDSAAYANAPSCNLNPYPGYANFLVESCPVNNLIGTCQFSTHNMYYYQGYLVISPSTTASVLADGCATDGGSWQ